MSNCYILIFMILHLIKRPSISQWSHLFSSQWSIYQTHDYDCFYSQISPTLEHVVVLSHYTQSYQQIFVSQGPHSNNIHPRNCGHLRQQHTCYLSHRTLIFQKNCFICSSKSHLKMMKNAFYFILKAFFVLKIFNFLS